MSDSRQSVVLTEKSDIRSALAVAVNSLKRGLDSHNTLLYFKALFLEPVSEKFMCMELFHSDLRMVEDIVCHRCHLVPDLIDILEHDFLQHKKHLRCLIPQ